MWKCDNTTDEFKTHPRRYSVNASDFLNGSGNNLKSHQLVEQKSCSKWKKDAAATLKCFKRAVHFDGKSSSSKMSKNGSATKNDPTTPKSADLERQQPITPLTLGPLARGVLSRRVASLDVDDQTTATRDANHTVVAALQNHSPTSGLGDLLLERLRAFRPRANSDYAAALKANQERRRSSGADTGVESMASSGGGGDTSGYYSNGSNESSTLRGPQSACRRTAAATGTARSSISSSQGGAGADEGFASSEDVRRPLFVDTTMANAWLGASRQAKRSGDEQGDEEDDSFFGAPATCRRAMSIGAESLQAKRAMNLLSMRTVSGGGIVTPAGVATRRRRNSEFGRYLIMRKSQEPGGINELVAQLEENSEHAYCQLLCSMKCYDLMPLMSKMIVLDCSLSIRRAFGAMSSHGCRAAPVIDCSGSAILGLLTVTDLLVALLRLVRSPVPGDGEADQLTIDATLSDGLGYCKPDDTGAAQRHLRRRPVFVHAENNLYSVSKLLCDQRLHQLIVCHSDQNCDPLFLISKKMILKALHRYIERLPLPACMHSTLEQLRLGNWTDLATVAPQATLLECLEKFAERDVSCLPVTSDEPDKQGVLLEILTKADLMNLVIDAWDSDRAAMLLKPVQYVIAAKKENNYQKVVTCHKRITLVLAVESLLRADAHRLAVLDSVGRLEAVVSVADLMRFLTGG